MNDNNQPPMNGNDDLAKTLNEGLEFEETPMSGGSPAMPPHAPDTPMPSMDPTGGSEPNDAKDDMSAPTMDMMPPVDEPKKDNPKSDNKPSKPSSSGSSDLDGLKASALEELRPLVGKLKLPAEERFDTLLLIIRSTDDQSLLNQAHDAAKDITDDTRRAQALLDIIKEIDYFSSKR